MAGLTVLYDEDCGLCTTLARRLERHGVGIATIGSATGALLLRDLTQAQRYATVHAVDVVGRRASGAAALPHVLRELPGGRPAAALLALAPGLAESMYALVAGNRTSISRLLRLSRPGGE